MLTAPALLTVRDTGSTHRTVVNLSEEGVWSQAHHLPNRNFFNYPTVGRQTLRNVAADHFDPQVAGTPLIRRKPLNYRRLATPTDRASEG